MGLGIWAAAKVGKNGPKLLDAIAEEIPEIVEETDEVMAHALSVSNEDGTVMARLFPGAESLEFTVNDGMLIASNKTSTTGPGYHAAVVDVIDRVGQVCGVKWDWSGDETEYGEKRDFAALQRAMGTHLKMLAKMISEQLAKPGMSRPTLVHWRAGASVPDGPWDIVTPSGAWSKPWFADVAAGGGGDEAAEAFYPWWARERGEREWAKLAAMLMWSEVRWHPPTDEEEELWTRLALHAAEHATEDGLAALGVEAADVEELAELFEADPDEAGAPRAVGFGMYRGMMNWSIGGGWTIRLPGYAHQEFEEETDSLLIWTPGRNARFTVMEAESDPSATPMREDLLAHIKQHAKGGRTIDCSKGHIFAVAGHTEVDEEGYTSLLGAAVVEHPVTKAAEAAMVTITYANPADAAWAEAAFRTIERGPMNDDEGGGDSDDE